MDSAAQGFSGPDVGLFGEVGPNKSGLLNNGRLVGIVSRSDLVMFILQNKSALVRGMAQC